MAQKSIQGSQQLAKKIRLRRNELNLTIEEAALRAGVGMKTWSRYEAGESIRIDKCQGICKALNWRNFPGSEEGIAKKSLMEEYRNHEAWSQFLAENYGSGAAVSFAVGSDILLDFVEEDLSDLASMSSGSHIGQLSASFICNELPPQFLIKYDYDFVYRMKCTLLQLRWRAKHGMSMIAHSILEELIIYLCSEEAQAFIEIGAGADEFIGSEGLDYSGDWVFDMFDGEDIITYLYSNHYLTEDHPFYFTQWGVQQFYMD